MSYIAQVNYSLLELLGYKQQAPFFQVSGFPTLNIYKNGEKIEEYNGQRTIEDLEAFISKHLAKKDEL